MPLPTGYQQNSKGSRISRFDSNHDNNNMMASFAQNFEDKFTVNSQSKPSSFTNLSHMTAESQVEDETLSRFRGIKLEVSLSALDFSPTKDRLVVAGRDVLKVLSVDSFDTLQNLREGYKLNTSLPTTDVSWGNGYSSDRLCTSTTNGTIALWNLNRPNLKVERLFSDHVRAVNKVKFLTNGSLVASASQDGSIKIWDIRTKDPAKISIYPKSEAVRDLQINPNGSEELVAAFENGSLQVFDIRQPNQNIQKLTAHSGIALAVDWHSDGRTIVSGGRDKLIKVWDVKSDSRKPTNVIQTIAAVQRVQWRPSSNYIVASTSLSTDLAINVWDIGRPLIPKYLLTGHSNVTTSFLWLDHHSIVSCSKDQYVLQRNLNHSEGYSDYGNDYTNNNQEGCKEPIHYLTKSGMDFDVGGNLAFFVDKPNHFFNKNQNDFGDSYSSAFNKLSLNDKKFRMIQSQTSGILEPNDFDRTKFTFLAQHYVVDVNNFQDMLLALETNANLAFEIGYYRTAQTWRILSYLCQLDQIYLSTSESEEELIPEDTINPPSSTNKVLVLSQEPESVFDDSADELKLETVQGSIIPNKELDQLNHLELDEWLQSIVNYPNPSADSGVGGEVDLETVDKTSPSMPKSHSNNSIANLDTSSRTTTPPTPSQPYHSHKKEMEVLSNWSYLETIYETFNHYADEGDVQMLTTLATVLHPLNLNLPRFEAWSLNYYKLLQRSQLYVEATTLCHNSKFNCLTSSNGQSTTLYTLCLSCSKPLGDQTAYHVCSKCSKRAVCTYCNQLCKGTIAICIRCNHLGHALCWKEFFSKGNITCPSGCGCNCSNFGQFI